MAEPLMPKVNYLAVACLVLAVLSMMEFNREAAKNVHLELEKPKQTIKIGVSLPLNGNIGYMGAALKGSLDIAKEDLADRKLKNDYEFIVENNSYEAKQISAVNSKFIFQDKVDAVISFASLTGNLTTLALKDKNILHFNVCASDKNIADGKTNFLHTTLPRQEAVELVKMIQGKYSNVAVVSSNEVSTDSSDQEIIKELKAKQINFKEYTINPGERDMRLLIEKIKANQPDLLVILLYSPTIEIFAKQLKEKNINTAMMSTHYFSNTKEPELFEGSLFVDYAQVEGRMRQRIIEKNKDVSNYMMCTGNMYDVIMMTVDSFEKGNALNNLRSLKSYGGVMGHVEQDEKGIFQVTPVKRIIKNGQIKKYDNE